jgi:LDH2 family malate/lactate/ureidoglycolate dehydrogenase
MCNGAIQSTLGKRWREQFDREVRSFIRYIESSVRLFGGEESLIQGEPEQLRRKASREGHPIEDNLTGELQALYSSPGLSWEINRQYSGLRRKENGETCKG